jgi:hypothetical protein
LLKEVHSFQREHPEMLVLDTPEAAGVNITATMKSIGIDLEWPPKTVTYQVVVAGSPVLEEKTCQ